MFDLQLIELIGLFLQFVLVLEDDFSIDDQELTLLTPFCLPFRCRFLVVSQLLIEFVDGLVLGWV